MDEEAIPTAGKGSSAFRFIIPTQKLVDAGLSQSLNIGPVFGMTVAPENNRWLVWYPCRGWVVWTVAFVLVLILSEVNFSTFAAFILTGMKKIHKVLSSFSCSNVYSLIPELGANEWSLATSQASLLDEFQTFHPDLVKACTYVNDTVAK